MDIRIHRDVAFSLSKKRMKSFVKKRKTPQREFTGNLFSRRKYFPNFDQMNIGKLDIFLPTEHTLNVIVITKLKELSLC